ncbi:hypothetical protein [Variovorax sp. tm]|uniref:hypothetical protein n=1 Tax=Variovorax atrisoli TaxID=3394203 RepID=UPI003A8036D4
MEKISATADSSQMSFDDAISLTGREFLSRHPQATWPDWLDECVTRGGTRDSNGRWVVSYTIAYKEPLKPGEYWDNIQGRRVLCKTNPKTGSAQVIIHRRASAPPFVLFEVAIDARSGEATVLVDTDLSGLNRDDFE